MIRSRWAMLVALPSGALLIAAMGYLWLVWTALDDEVADKKASVIGALLALAVAAVGILGWGVRRTVAARNPASAAQLNEAADTLCGQIHEQWTVESEIRGLTDPEPMPVRWYVTRRGRRTSSTDHRHEQFSLDGSSSEIAGLADLIRMRSCRRLVITGGRGTGKTTLALRLLLELLRERRTEDPVPVILPVGSWNPDIHRRLQDWLTVQLELYYPSLLAISRDAPGALAAQGRVLPIIDGLDEVELSRRQQIVHSIASFPGEVVLTSRTDEYFAATSEEQRGLTGAIIIGPRALSPDDAKRYLRSCMPRQVDETWTKPLDNLLAGRAPALRALTATPLGLWLVRATCIESRDDPGPLQEAARAATYDELLTSLLDQLIPAAVHSRRPAAARHTNSAASLLPSRQHDPADLQRWLSTLARQISNSADADNGADWRWWELGLKAFPSWRSRIMLRLAIIAAYTMLPYALLGIPLAAGIYVLPFAVPIAVAIRFKASPRHFNVRIRRRKTELARCLLHGLAFGLAVGASVSLLGLLAIIVAWDVGVGSNTIPAVLRNTATLGFPLGLLVGTRSFLTSQDITDGVTSPTRSLRLDTARMGIEYLLAWLVVGASTGLIALLLGTLPSIALLFGVAASQIAQILWLWGQVQISFRIASAWLALRRKLPWRLMRTLDDCHKYGLLRTAGPIYQFRHAELQKFLASRRR